MRTTTATAVVAMLLTAVPSFAGAGQSAACDRACLQNIADSYVRGARRARSIEGADGAQREVHRADERAEGRRGILWKSAVSASTAFKIPVPDPVWDKSA